MMRKRISVAFVAIAMLGGTVLIAGAEPYKFGQWDKTQPEEGVMAFVSNESAHSTARASVVGPKAFKKGASVEEELFVNASQLGLLITYDQGILDLGGGEIAVWGRASDEAGTAYKFLATAKRGNSMMMFAATPEDFNLYEAAKVFPNLQDFRPNGAEKLLAKLDAQGVVRPSKPVGRYALGETSKKTVAAPRRQTEAASKVETTKSAKTSTDTKTNKNNNPEFWPKPKSKEEVEAVKQIRAAFPDAIAPPPFQYKTAKGGTWVAQYNTKLPSGAASTSSKAGSPLFDFRKLNLPDGSFNDYIDKALSDAGLKNVRNESIAYSQGWRMHGTHYMVEFGDAKLNGRDVRYFVDFYGTRAPFTVQVIAAPHDIFESWGGSAAILAYNGYLDNPGQLDDATREFLGEASPTVSTYAYMTRVDGKMNGLMNAFAGSLIEHVNSMRRMNEAGMREAMREWSVQGGEADFE